MDLNIKKYLFGLFYKENFSYDVQKGAMLNWFREYFRDINIDYLKNKLFGDVFICQDPKQKFQIKLKNDMLHFERKESKDNFKSHAVDIFLNHKEIFNPTQYTRAGFVAYFEMNINIKEKYDYLINKLLNNIPKDNTRESEINMKYNKKISDNDYILNISLNQENQEKITGLVDLFRYYDKDNEINTEKLIENFKQLNYYVKNDFQKDFFR